MPNIDDQLDKKKLFKKKNYRSYLSLDESLDSESSTDFTVTNPTPAFDELKTEHKVDTKLGFSTLIGLQKDLTILAYKSCQKERSKTTEALTTSYISNSLKVNISSIKTTFRRLEGKGILKRIAHKNGRGGWAKFELLDSVYNELRQLETEHKLNTKWT